jgi:hypothetical protein
MGNEGKVDDRRGVLAAVHDVGLRREKVGSRSVGQSFLAEYSTDLLRFVPLYDKICSCVIIDTSNSEMRDDRVEGGEFQRYRHVDNSMGNREGNNARRGLLAAVIHDRDVVIDLIAVHDVECGQYNTLSSVFLQTVAHYRTQRISLILQSPIQDALLNSFNFGCALEGQRPEKV